MRSSATTSSSSSSSEVSNAGLRWAAASLVWASPCERQNATKGSWVLQRRSSRAQKPNHGRPAVCFHSPSVGVVVASGAPSDPALATTAPTATHSRYSKLSATTRRTEERRGGKECVSNGLTSGVGG